MDNIKSFQDIARGKCDINLKLAEKLAKMKADLKQAKSNLTNVKHIVEEKSIENLNLQKKIFNLDQVIPIQNKRVEDLTQEYVKIHMLVDEMQCQLFKAQVVSSCEEASKKKHLTSMEACKMTIQSEAGERAKKLQDQVERKSQLAKEIENLLKEVEEKRQQTEENLKQLELLNQKNLMLKKRNEARLLRLKKQVQKTQEYRRTLLHKQHIEK